MTVTSKPPSEAAGGGASPAMISFGYSAVEDRIVAVIARDNSGATMLLTRRLVREAIPSLWRFLERSSPLAQRAPVAMRAEVLQTEHQGAVAKLATGRGLPPPAAAVARQSPARLVVRLDVVPDGEAYVLAFADAGGGQVRVRLAWQDLHRLVGALHRQAASARWDLAAGAPWVAGQPSGSRA